jgi:hypothetical protein
MTETTRKLLWAYVAVGVLTLMFQIYVRLPQCDAISDCVTTMGKGVVWSAIWPVSWLVYLRG